MKTDLPAKYLISQLRRAEWELKVVRQAVLDQEMEVARLERELGWASCTYHGECPQKDVCTNGKCAGPMGAVIGLS